MAGELLIDKNLDKEEKYQLLLPQVKALVAGEKDLMANLANIAAALKYGMDFFWVGFYLVKDGELVLGPFQGPIACTRIQKGKGVCGTSWQNRETIIVPDVDLFQGHIACNNDSKSEIVIPFFDKDQVTMILDVDSDQLNAFDSIDQQYLETLRDLI